MSTPSRLLLLIFFICLQISLSGQEHMPVHKEPYHKTVYQSDEFRVIQLKMAKGDTSQIHSHRYPILYITLQGTTMWLDEIDKGDRTVGLPTGWIGSDNYSTKDPFIHRISVAGEDSLLLTAVIRYQENQLPADSSAVYADDGFQVFQKDRILPGARIFIVLEGNAKTNQKILQKGDPFEKPEDLVYTSSDFKFLQVVF